MSHGVAHHGSHAVGCLVQPDASLVIVFQRAGQRLGVTIETVWRSGPEAIVAGCDPDAIALGVLSVAIDHWPTTGEEALAVVGLTVDLARAAVASQPSTRAKA